MALLYPRKSRGSQCPILIGLITNYLHPDASTRIRLQTAFRCKWNLRHLLQLSEATRRSQNHITNHLLSLIQGNVLTVEHHFHKCLMAISWYVTWTSPLHSLRTCAKCCWRQVSSCTSHICSCSWPADAKGHRNKTIAQDKGLLWGPQLGLCTHPSNRHIQHGGSNTKFSTARLLCAHGRLRPDG